MQKCYKAARSNRHTIGLNRSFRRMAFESLENRDLLNASGLTLSALRTEWSDFSFSDDLTVQEISASELSTVKLRAALENAQNTLGDDLIVLHTTDLLNTISFSSSDSEFVVNVGNGSGVTILTDGPEALAIDAKGFSRIFSIQSGLCQIGGITLRNGYTESVIDGTNSNYGTGGALVISTSSTVILDSVRIENSTVGSALAVAESVYSSFFSKGGAIYNAGSLTIIDSDLTGNTAKSSGCNKLNNTAFGAGGGIFNDKGVLKLRNTNITNNTSENGLAYYTVNVNNVMETRSVRQEGCGGGIYSVEGTVSIVGGLFSNNESSYGGAVYMTGGAVACSDQVLFDSNNATIEGGGILTRGQNTTLSIDRSEFFGNTAGVKGGALAIRSELTMSNTVLSGNEAGHSGGAICLFGSYTSGTPTKLINLTNCTVTGNSAGTIESGTGGGIFFSGTDNSDVFAKMYIKNSIIIGNKTIRSASATADLNIAPANKNDLLYGYYTLTTFTDWTLHSNNPNCSANFSPFQRDYSFETKTRGDYRLDPDASDSLIDSGYNSYADSYTLDCSGQTRIYGTTVDLGAYEYRPTPINAELPTNLTVIQDSLIYIDTHLISDGSVKEYWDLSGRKNGVFVEKPSAFWLNTADWNLTPGDLILQYKTIDQNGVESNLVDIPLTVAAASPSITVETIELFDSRLLVLNFTVRLATGQKIQQWRINWDDSTSQTILTGSMLSFSAVHYYQSFGVYDLTLQIKDGNGIKTTYQLGQHITERTTVQGAQEKALSQEITAEEQIQERIDSPIEDPINRFELQTESESQTILINAAFFDDEDELDDDFPSLKQAADPIAPENRLLTRPENELYENRVAESTNNSSFPILPMDQKVSTSSENKSSSAESIEEYLKEEYLKIFALNAVVSEELF